MIRFDKVSKSFGDIKAVQSISFEIEKGKNLILLGTSGCGKTTTLRMVNRLIEASSGSISIDGRDIFSIPPEKLRREIGYVIQNIGLFPHYTIRENISVVPRLLNWDKSKTENSIADILTKVHLSESFLDSYPHELSGGQQQRVGLARALITDPPVVLMDEPLGALDPITRNLIRNEFKTLEAIKEKTVLMVTHDVEEAFEIGDEICLMDQGVIQQMGTPKTLLFRPVNNFVKEFFDAQRHQLQMKTVRLEEVDLSPHYSTKSSLTDFKVEPTISFYDLFNLIALKEDSSSISITSNKGSLQIEITQQELFELYQQAIKLLHHG